MVQLTVWAIPPLLATLVATALYVRVRQNNHVPGVHALLLLILGLIYWSIGQVIAHSLVVPAHKILALKLSYIGLLFIPVAWFAFGVSYARRQLRISPMLLNAVCVVPAITLVLAATNDWHGLVWGPFDVINDDGYIGLNVTSGPVLYVQMAYSAVLLIAGTTILAYILSVSQSNWRPVAAVTLAPTLGVLFALFSVSPWNNVGWLDLRALGFALSAWVMYRGVLTYGLLDNIPVVRDRVVNQLSDPVVVVNTTGSIVDANQAAQNMFSMTRRELTRSTIAQFVPNWPRKALEADGSAIDEITIGGQIYDVAFSCLESSAKHSDVVLVFRDVTVRREDERRLRRMQKELERLAHTDALTGLYNRRIFMQRLEEEAERVRRHGSVLSVVLFDLDFFKRVNDTYGHDTGDVVLASVAKVTTEIKRVSDVAARLGGEEFGLLLPETDQQGAVHLAQRLRMAIEKYQYMSPSGAPLKVTASIGVATVSRDAEDVEKLLNSADRALYRAKNNGRNRVCSTVL